MRPRRSSRLSGALARFLLASGLLEAAAAHVPGAQAHRELVAAEAMAMYGRCYQLKLDLLELGTDVLRPIHGNVTAAYEPADGGPVVHSSRELRPVRLGRQVP